jgi:Tfp pilus assembly protein PilF
MSLLADLLSKKNNAKPSGGKDIPPTLVRAHGMPTKVRNLKNRYVIVSLISVVTITVSVFAMSQFGQFGLFSIKKPALAPQPVKPPVAVAPVAVPAPVSALAPVSTPAPVSAPTPVSAVAAVSQVSQTATKHARKKSPARTLTRRRLGAIQPARRAATKKSAVTAVAEPGGASSGKIDTANRDSLLYSARSAEQNGNWNLALTIYRKALKIDPENYKIMSNTSAALNNLGLFDEGGKEARRALGKKPDYVPAMINAAIAYSSTGKSQDALDLFSKASSADPGNRNLTINFGILQERTGKLEDAQKTYRRLADDGDPLALHGMGRIFERTDNKSEAARVYRQILALPNASPALKKEVKRKLVRLEE